jgi:hypothetical protein
MVIFTILIYTLTFSSLREDAFNDLSYLMKEAPIEASEPSQRHEGTLMRKPLNEIALLLLGAIRLYQIFISTQDMPACNFIPTCSNFGLQAIRRFGPLKGLLLTSDRLQRCHGLAHLYAGTVYEVDETTGKLKDPPERYGR